ncbi:hypothetical protein HF324_12565 [Chitinophaga oryzae]|uniref:Secretin/TonB short N-terminal domain-containing protein n=1 Tax=Chitinophaga oryzae TaxID=2725414 RepID=A0ABX6LEX3_9BACT|nr:hypothetical protein [Chitinophaga oryzae]QJB38653.1 hypothetical protein HF324_12565 [Chitinophaga oryzae]
MRSVLTNRKQWILWPLLCCWVPLQAIAQAVPDAQKNITIDNPLVRFDNLLEDIQEQTGFLFSIDTRRFPPGATIRLQPGRYKVQQLLQLLHHRAGMDFRTVGNHIVVTDKPKTISRQAAGCTKQQSPVISPLEQIHTSFPPKLSFPDTPIYCIPAHYAVLQKRDSADTILVRADTAITGRNSHSLRHGPATTYKSSLQLPPMGGLYFCAGWNIDDYSFVNLFAAAGYKRLHLAAAITLKEQSRMVRLGAGTQIPLSSHTDLSAVILLSRLSGSFTTPDTIKKTKIEVTGNWVQANAGIVRHLNNHFSIQAGITFNMLFRRYYEDGEMVAPMLEKETFLHTYGLVSPLLNLHDSYHKQQATSTGIWIGFQAGVIYHIRIKRKKTLLSCPANTAHNL